MSKDFSFDVVSDYDLQEMNNAVDQTKRELAVRYDFRGTNPEISFADDKSGLVLSADSESKLNAIIDVLETKMIKRNLSLKILDLSGPVEAASGARVRKKITLKKGLGGESAKKITRLIHDAYPKVKTNIQGNSVRVSSSSKDELQLVMQLLRGAPELNFPLQFKNFK